MAALAFYGYTLSPSVGWGDAARLQMDVSLRGSTYWFLDEADRTTTDGWPFQYLGVAVWDHPLYVMLGQLFVTSPGLDAARRINLMSALAAGLTVALAFAVGVSLTGDRRAALLAAAALAVSHTFWFHAVTAEVYALHALFMVAVIGFALDRERKVTSGRLAVAFVAGLAMANHLLFALTVVTLICCSPRSWGRRTIIGEPVWQIGAFLLGFAPWWIQFFRMTKAVGFSPTVQAASGFPVLGERLSAGSVVPALMNLAFYAGWLVYQFTPFGVAVGVAGFVCLRRSRPDAFRVLLALFIVHVAFSANYQVVDRFAFHLFSYVIFALVMATGFSRLLGALALRLQNRPRLLGAAVSAVLMLVLSPVALYSVVPKALRGAGLEDAALGIPPVGTGARDGIRYFLNPNRRGDESADRFGRSTLEALEPDALVFVPKESDQETYLVLRYFQLVHKRRPDVEFDLLLSEPTASVPTAILSRVRAASDCRPVYFASLNPRSYPLDGMRGEFTVTPEANVYRVRPIDHSGSRTGCHGVRVPRRAVPVNMLVREALSKR